MRQLNEYSAIALRREHFSSNVYMIRSSKLPVYVAASYEYTILNTYILYIRSIYVCVKCAIFQENRLDHVSQHM